MQLHPLGSPMQWEESPISTHPNAGYPYTPPPLLSGELNSDEGQRIVVHSLGSLMQGLGGGKENINSENCHADESRSEKCLKKMCPT